MGDRLTFLDCPGSIEFAFEAEAVLAGVDLAVVVAEADEKKIPALQVILKTLEDKGIPRILFLNKMDKADGSVRQTLETLQPASGVPLVLRHIPIWQNGIVTGFIDLALERAFVYREHAASEIIDMADDDRAREVEARFTMLETLADYDDGLMEQLLEDIQPTARRSLQRPGQGDARRRDLPGADRRRRAGATASAGCSRPSATRRRTSPRPAPASALTDGGDAVVQVLKTLHTTHGGKLSVARVLAGTVGDGAELIGPGRARSGACLRRLPDHGPAGDQARRRPGRRDRRPRQARRRQDRR